MAGFSRSVRKVNRRTKRNLIMETTDLKKSVGMKMKWIRFAVLVAGTYFGISSTSHADFTFNVEYSDGEGYATFLAEGASDMASYSLDPGNLIVASLTNTSGGPATFGSFLVTLQGPNPATPPAYYGSEPNDIIQIIPEGGTYLFEYGGFLASGSTISNFLSPTWDLSDAITVNGTWTPASPSAPEPLSILGAVAALGFGVVLHRLKPKRAA